MAIQFKFSCNKGHPWPRSYGSWKYIYLCNQPALSLLKYYFLYVHEHFAWAIFPSYLGGQIWWHPYQAVVNYFLYLINWFFFWLAVRLSLCLDLSFCFRYYYLLPVLLSMTTAWYGCHQIWPPRYEGNIGSSRRCQWNTGLPESVICFFILPYPVFTKISQCGRIVTSKMNL
jgi:hypothetical protein